ncbi:MAG: hypothetical protein MPF33_08025 [Candidatus Aramenus sp.]|nr:hypothetical protein [Candidatus Aramenus sp.]
MKFLRESTGLIREMGPLDAFALNFSFIGPAAGISYPLFVASFLPGANWILALLIGALLSLPLLFNYYFLSLKLPRSSSDYIFVSRTLGGMMGVILAMSLIVSFAMGFPVLAELEVIMVLSPTMQLLGYSLRDPNLIFIGNELTDNVNYLTLATTLIIIIAFLISSNSKWFFKTFRYLTFLQIIGTIVMVLGMVALKSAFSPYYQPSPPKFSFTETFLLSSVFVLSMYAFVNAPAFFAGEARKPRKSFALGYFASYAVATAFSLALILALEYSIGVGGFISVSTERWNLPISTSSLLSFGSLPFLDSLPLLLLVIASGLTWYLLYAMINVGASSRFLFSLAFDRVLPSFLGEIKRGIPVNALIFSLSLSLFFELIEVYLGYSVSFAVDGLWFLTWNYLLVSLASAITVRKDLKLGVSGLLSSVSLALTAFIAVFYGLKYANVIFSGDVYFDLLTIVIPPLAGLTTYLTAKRVRKVQGIDLDSTFREIPPE